MNDPWAFGWTQTLTIVGFLITIFIAVGGFRSFGRWRREQLESKRIDVAIEALTIAYKSKFVFGHIRGAMSYGDEWHDMPTLPDDSDEKRRRRGIFYGILKRVELHRDYFDAVWTLQPKFMAVFGPATEDIFRKLHGARRNIEIAAQMLYEKALEGERNSDDKKFWNKLRGHIWAPMTKFNDEGDEVQKALDDFKDEIEAICLPFLAEFRKDVQPMEKGLMRKLITLKFLTS
jgi:hypothetical protein